MYSDYAIYIRDKEGNFRDRLVNIESLDIIESLNDPGTWTIKSTTPERCPFTAGDGIVVYKNGKYYYSGVLKKISENYDGYDAQYKWTASGASDLEFLKRRIVYVDPETGSTTENAYYTATGTLGNVIKDLIDRNLGPLAMEPRREPFVAEIPVIAPMGEVSVSLRFPILLTAIVPLLEAYQCSILPEWNADTKKLTFRIRKSNDLSQLLLFSTELNSVITIDYLANAPVGNFIMSAGQGELTERSFAYAESEDSMDEWGRIEYYHDVRSTTPEELQSDADTTLEKNAAENVGYSANLNTDASSLQYRTDWNLGDFVGVVVHGTTLVRRVLQVETKLTYERETVTPTIGTVDRGVLVGIFKQLEQLRSDVDHLEWTNS